MGGGSERSSLSMRLVECSTVLGWNIRMGVLWVIIWLFIVFCSCTCSEVSVLSMMVLVVLFLSASKVMMVWFRLLFMLIDVMFMCSSCSLFSWLSFLLMIFCSSSLSWIVRGIWCGVLLFV